MKSLKIVSVHSDWCSVSPELGRCTRKGLELAIEAALTIGQNHHQCHLQQVAQVEIYYGQSKAEQTERVQWQSQKQAVRCIWAKLRNVEVYWLTLVWFGVVGTTAASDRKALRVSVAINHVRG